MAAKVAGRCAHSQEERRGIRPKDAILQGIYESIRRFADAKMSSDIGRFRWVRQQNGSAA